VNNNYDAQNARVQKARAMLSEVRARESAHTTPAAKTPLPDPKDKIEEQNLLHTAMLASDDDRPAEARQALQNVLTLDPKSPTALRQLGELELQAADYGKPHNI